MSFLVGDVVRGSRTFTNFAGTVADPTTVSLTMQTPAGVSTTYTYAAGEITKSGVGIYYKYITLNAAGAWDWRWATTGDPEVVAQGSFIVEPSNV